MPQFKRSGVVMPKDEFGIPPEDPAKPVLPRKGRFGADTGKPLDPSQLPSGYGRAVTAGGMVYVSAIGPVNPDTGQIVPGGIKDQTRQCLSNLAKKLLDSGTSLDKVVWANWSLRDPSEFDTFNEEWTRWFPGDAPVGQCTLMPALQRRAGFRISIGVIAEA